MRPFLLAILAFCLLTSAWPATPANCEDLFFPLSLSNQSYTNCYNLEVKSVSGYIISRDYHLLKTRSGTAMGIGGAPTILQISYCRIAKEKCTKTCNTFTPAWDIGSRKYSPTREFDVIISSDDQVKVTVLHD